MYSHQVNMKFVVEDMLHYKSLSWLFNAVKQKQKTKNK